MLHHDNYKIWTYFLQYNNVMLSYMYCIIYSEIFLLGREIQKERVQERIDASIDQHQTSPEMTD